MSLYWAPTFKLPKKYLIYKFKRFQLSSERILLNVNWKKICKPPIEGEHRFKDVSEVPVQDM